MRVQAWDTTGIFVNYITERHTFVTVNKRKKLVTAIIIDEAGNIIKGHALCDPEDIFDRDFGAALATARASIRYFKRQEKLLLRESDRK
jgi:hypothetical protein